MRLSLNCMNPTCVPFRREWFADLAPRLYSRLRIRLATTGDPQDLGAASRSYAKLPWPLEQLCGVTKTAAEKREDTLEGVAWARQTAYKALESLAVPLHDHSHCEQYDEDNRGS